MAHQYGGGRTCDPRHVVVLRQPVALETQRLRMLRCAQSDLQGLPHRAAFADGNQIKHGKAGKVVCGHGEIVANAVYPCRG